MGLIFKIGSRLLINSMKKDEVKEYLTPDGTYSLEKDLKYLDDGDPRHTFNIYRYLGKDKKKGLLFHIHGGSWIYGDKMFADPYYVSLVKQGYDLVSISYRLIPSVTIDEEIKDCYQALKYILNNSDLNLDTSKVLLIGDSAGGHLAMMAYALASFPQLSKFYDVSTFSHHIVMLALLHPVLELHRILGLLENKTNYYLDKKMEEVFFKGYKESPYYYHSCLSEIVNDGKFPLVYLLTSEADGLMKHSLFAYDLLTKKGNEVNFQVTPYFKKLGHVYEILHPEYKESQEVNEKMLDIFSSL